MIHPTAEVEGQIGEGTQVWHQAQIRAGATVGANCIIGKGAYIDAGVAIGDNCKVQNYACIYGPAVLGDGVFIGPHAVLTNDKYPRAINPDGTLKEAGDWEAQGVMVRCGASIGANAVILPGVVIGEWAMVGAGSIVTKDVAMAHLVVGIPAENRAIIDTANVIRRRFSQEER